MSFEEFNKAYDEALLPENPDRFNLIAASTRFNIYNSPIWSGTGNIFARAVVDECCQHVGEAEAIEIRRYFGME